MVFLWKVISCCHLSTIRYYVGKLLTSADFQAEQTYNDHKRRFLNEMMFGSGIVCGLGVYSLDDLAVIWTLV